MINNPDLFEATYEEELYRVQPPTTIVIDTKWSNLPENERQLLSKILGSVKLTLAAVRIVETQELDLSQWVEKPTKLIGFGIKVAGVGMYDVVTTPKTQLLLADRLSSLVDDDDLKKKLWISLKRLFFG